MESVIGGGAGGVTGGGAMTVTRASAVALPPGPLARAAYVVESVGLTVRLPDGSTVPIPSLIVTFEALLVFQLRVVLWPFSIVEGLAENVIVGAGGGGAGGGGAGAGGAAGGGATFFVQPVPVIDKPTRRIIATVTANGERLITYASFLLVSWNFQSS